ncbi:pentapeptide repeat-containing protein [Nocardia sp. NPDC055165]
MSAVGAHARMKSTALRARVDRAALSRRTSRIRLFAAVGLVLVAGLVVAFAAYGLLRWITPVDHAKAAAEIDVTRMALTVVAGVGGVVALVIAYRRQRDLEQGRFVERFGAAAAQLGTTDVAVRIAGVYAMAGAADESEGLRRQQCIDVLCGYLRLPFDAAHGASGRTKFVIKAPWFECGRVRGETEEHVEYRQNDSEVRKTIVRVIADRLRPEAEYSWSASDFDFRTAHLEDVDLSRATFSGAARFAETTFTGVTTFKEATFTRDTTFDGVTFTGGATFDGVTFTGGATFNKATFTLFTTFDGATFTGGAAFDRAMFTDGATFNKATTFTGAGVVVFGKATTFTSSATFNGATFTGITLFYGATFSDATFDVVTFTSDVAFDGATFTGDAKFEEATFTRSATFDKATFSGAVTFDKATFTGDATFEEAMFTGDAMFEEATFTRSATFDKATFAGVSSFLAADFGSGRISFIRPRQWGPPPPVFDWGDDGVGKPSNVKPQSWPPVANTMNSPGVGDRAAVEN